MTSQQPTTLHTNESKLRQAATLRKERQWYIDTALRFKIYRNRFINLLGLLTKDRLPDTDPQLSSTLAKEIEAWEALETLLLEVPQIAPIKAQPVHLPDTGDIPLEQMTPGQRNERTTASQYEETSASQAIHELMTDCQSRIRAFYHTQRHMPRQINLGALNYFSLTPFCVKSAASSDKYFPQTKVLVQLDLSLGDQIICE